MTDHDTPELSPAMEHALTADPGNHYVVTGNMRTLNALRARGLVTFRVGHDGHLIAAALTNAGREVRKYLLTREG
ncbi:MAG: hypothetical protein JWO67_3838 [Streptosporangiaceae bacterium]|nr:hypothetical protein [Streptosporangiaceae bacterium]